jgi:hypothetical protein
MKLIRFSQARLEPLLWRRHRQPPRRVHGDAMTGQRLLIVEDDPAPGHTHAPAFTAEVSEKPFQ